MSSSHSLLAEEPIKPKVADAYTDLGVSPAASKAEIKVAFSRLALQHHPDKKAPGQAVDAADFRRIYEAWDLLRNEETKAKYDKGYSNVIREWSAYRIDLAEYQRDPHDWQQKKHAEMIKQQMESDLKAKADRKANTRRSQPEPRYEYYDDGDSDPEDFWDYGPYSSYGFPFGGAYAHSSYMPGGYGYSGYGYYGEDSSDEEEDLDGWLREHIRAQRRWNQSNHFEHEQKNKRRQAINKRCLEKLKEATEQRQAKSDGIRISSMEEKCAMAKDWVESLQRDYAAELHKASVKMEGTIDVGWEKKKGRQKCTFCNVQVSEFSFRCPSGGAIACKGCKRKIESSTLKKPFAFVHTDAATKKKGKKGKAAKKAKKSKPKPGPESESGEESSDEDQVEDEEELARKAAEEAERKAEAERQEEERKAQRQEQEKLKRDAAEQAALEKAAREKAEAEEAARKKAAREKAAREAAQQKKDAREREAREKKAARKKATKERTALEKAAQRKLAGENGTNVQEEQEKEAKEREAQQIREKKKREAKEARARQAHEAAECEAREQEMREKMEREQQAREQAVRNQMEREIAEREAKENMEREARVLQACEKAEREAKEKMEREARERTELETRLRAAEAAKERLEKELRKKKAALEATERKAQEANKAREAKERRTRVAEEKKASRIEDQQAEKTSAPTPDRPVLAMATNTTKKPNKKGPMCYFCDQRGHLARDCVKKQAKLNGAAKVTSRPPPAEPAPAVEAMSKPLPPTIVAEKIVVKLPVRSDPKVEHDVSATSTGNAPVSETSSKANKPKKRQSRKSRPRTNDEANDIDTVSMPTNPSFVNGDTDASVKKPSKKAQWVCYVCNGQGHMARNCPTRSGEGAC
ncbi:chaperone protein [Pyrenophora tritici-repentis]|uniref:DnaJ domain containing protein n=1 Tax=Pyrenophora tritici-repentis TaxID=45151 RepID=A0A2W1EE64_9PLEO|nr:chaperone protein [Pyrenophora tritici-repentis]KAF7443410.1 chaperone protein [Pyrenophora tritici-repentis]KAI0572627.1 chaperone protein [Pyrenophora tritici-repentis]KAI0576336.1 chaperone protein [Pyrenophora tritici-repentis]KAI0606943.1 chaperone protein [Pyrenophora tritici-repentis]